MHRFFRLFFLSLICISWLQVAYAQYPERQIRIVVGFAAGQTATDLVARSAARKLEAALKQSVIVDNKPGAAGIIGSEIVAKAPPDGYTLMVTSTGPIAINPALYTKLSYTPKDFVPIAQLAIVPLFFAVNNNFPAATAGDFVKEARAKPGQINYSSAGIGVTSHLTMELFKRTQGIDLVHIPYKGGSAATTALMAGEVSAMFDTGPTLLPQHKAGKIRVLAVASKARNPAAPDVPTMAEAGVGAFEAPAFLGLFAPRGTPQSVVDAIYGALAQTWLTQDLRELLNGVGSEPVLTGPVEFARYVDEEVVRWAAVVKASGAKAD